MVSHLQAAGFEARHVESLREHDALTCGRRWPTLERSWDEAVAQVGPARARVWRLYMAGSALGFEAGLLNVRQVLAAPTGGGERATTTPGLGHAPLAGAKAAR